MNTTAIPGQLAFADDSVKPRRSIGATAGIRYKIVNVQIATPADMPDGEIVEAINFALTHTHIAEAAPLAHDWQFLARGEAAPLAHDWQFRAHDGAVGDNDHFREAIIDEDDLFAGAPQAIFEDWYLVPDGSASSPTDGTQCPQCERFFTTPEDIATIGDHALCTACLVAWRVTAAGSAGVRLSAHAEVSPTATSEGDDGDGYSEQPPFLPIPEWWAARGLAVPTESILPGTSIEDLAHFTGKNLTIDQVKETLPEVEVKYRGNIYAAKVRGRRNPFAEVSWETDCGTMYAEFAWETVTNAINNNEVLRA